MFLLTCAVDAQDKGAIDSLKSIIEEAKHDTSVCNAYLGWGERVHLNNPDTALILWQNAQEVAERNLATTPPPALKVKYSLLLANTLNSIGYIHFGHGKIEESLDFVLRGLKIFENIGDKNGLANSLNSIGFIYYHRGDIPKALEYYHKVLRNLEATGDKNGLANVLNNIGVIHKDLGDIPYALKYYHKSLKIREEIGDKMGIANSLNNIGSTYEYQGDTVNALKYYHKSLKIKEEIGDKSGIASSLSNIGGIYKNQGDIPFALEYYHKSLMIQEDIGNKRGIAGSLNNIGMIYKSQGDSAKALEFLHKSLKRREEIGDKKGIAVSLNNIGSIELELGRVTNALNYGMRGLEIAREIGSPRLISANSRLLSKVAKKQGQFQEALEMYELHILMRDSIKNEETQKATIRQQTKYEFEKAQLVKEQEEKEATRLEAEVTSRRDNLQYSVILIAILVLFGGVLSIGFVNVSERMAEGIIFFSFLILFEFLLVLADPYIEGWSGGAPGIKLLFNAGIAALIFPAHAFFEARLKGRLVKNKTG
ncbi:MAG: hypothetical protein COB85_09030 [Bacteroidetes bacterium]|nr:MAG: hypothetical protein COB85_09030 [Bacteroidota bacterium]